MKPNEDTISLRNKFTKYTGVQIYNSDSEFDFEYVWWLEKKVIENQWISVKDRLPENGSVVLGYHTADKIRIYTYVYDGFGDPLKNEYRGPVEFWQSILPEPTKE